jgi:hypothetical protein
LSWQNNCSRPVIIRYTTLNQCGYGPPGASGTTSRVDGMAEGSYNPTLRNCTLEWRNCFYDDWTRGICSLQN